MRIPNIHIEQNLNVSSETTIEGQAAQHLLKVLRMKVGDKLRLFNGDGNFYLAQITDAGKKSLNVEISEVEPALSESSLHTHLGQVVSRGDRMDYAIQKSTEMGVNEITPLTSERCEVKLNAERAEKRRLHWQQIAISAAEQCGRACVPKVHALTSLEEWITKTEGLSLVLHHRDTQTLESLDHPASVNLLIGPEGGLSAEEIELAKTRGAIAATLGPRVMRTETASVTALSIVQWLWGDLKQ